MESSDISDNIRGIYIITKRELRSHFKSIRMLILMILFVLAVLGGSYGMSSLSIQSDIVKTPEVMAWVFKVAEGDDGFNNDLLVYFTDLDGVPVNGVDYSVEYETKTTLTVFHKMDDAPAKSFVSNINDTDNFDAFSFQRAMIKYSKGGYSGERMIYDGSITLYESFKTQYYMVTQVTDLDGENLINDAIIMVLDTQTLEPVAGLRIDMYEESNLTRSIESRETNDNGVVLFYNLEGGALDPTNLMSLAKIYIFTSNYKVNNETEVATSFATIIFNFSLADLFKTDDPNQVLLFVGVMFITYLGPIVGIVICFDTIIKERLLNSMDFLLARPVSRRSIATGKFLGTFLSIGIPVTVINIAGVFIIWGKTGNMPDIGFAVSFILLTLAFITIYILIAQIISTVVKSTATAILGCFSLYLLFGLFWGLLTLGLNTLLGNSLNSDAGLAFSNQFALFSPNGIYQLLLFISMPGSTSADYVGVTNLGAYMALAVWLVGLFILAIELFNRRVRST